jgi:5-methylcytosine-specific restriction endonuclease McrA
MLLEPDHFVPTDKGGSPDADNVLTCCHICNSMKGKQVFGTIEEAKRELERYYENVKRDWHQKMISLSGAPSHPLP